MYLENLVHDSLDPQRLGRFWEAAVGGETLTDEPGIFETRLAVAGGPELDLCFQPVPEPPAGRPRLHPVLAADDVEREAGRLVALGAGRPDVPPGDGGEVVLSDPEGHPFGLEAAAAYAGSGPLAALRLDSADPDRDAELWAWLSGWRDVAGAAPRTLRHPAGLGPVLELVAERTPGAGTKNRRHLDVRLETSDDAAAVLAGIAQRGGREVPSPWGEVPWRLHVDASGNEFCLLPARP